MKPRVEPKPGEAGDVGEVDREEPVGEAGADRDEGGPGPDRPPGHVAFRHRPEDHQQIPKVTSRAAASSRKLSIALMSESPKGSRSVLVSSALSIAGTKMLAAMKRRTTTEHREGEALLLDPAAAFDVVDAAEGGVHRPPEGGADPERAEEGGDPDRRRVVLDPAEDVDQRLLLHVREEALEVVEHAGLDPVDLQHLAEDEEDQQGEGEDRQHQVVGDHRREAGDVLLVSALPKGA